MAGNETANWPSITLDEWLDTRDTLHLYTQVVGKVRLANEPLINHWWNSTLYVSARGLTTALMPHRRARHSRSISTSSITASTSPRSPARAARCRSNRCRSQTSSGGDVDARRTRVGTTIWPVPVEIAGAIPFTEDRVHASYDADAVHRFWLALVAHGSGVHPLPLAVRRQVEPRARLLGRARPRGTPGSPGDGAPDPGGAPNCGPHVMREAYSHEVSSCGYWPGPRRRRGRLLLLRLPEPPGYRDSPSARAGAPLRRRPRRVRPSLRSRPYRRRSRHRPARFPAEHLRGSGHDRRVGSSSPSSDPTETRTVEAPRAVVLCTLTALTSHKEPP